MLFLRQLPKSALGTRLSGEVEQYEDSAKQAFRRVGGVPNAAVKISSPKGSIFEAHTNVDGVYEVYNLRPGRYSVSIAIPKGLKIDFPVVTGAASSGDETTVELVKNGGVSVGFVLKADTRVRGRLLSATSNPIKGVCIDLEPLEGRGEDGSRFFDCSKADGTFKMEMMPPGSYWLEARDEIKANGLQSTSTLYYPGVRDKNDAKIISVEPGKYIEHLEIKLPSQEKRTRFTGRMQFQDGVPVADAIVSFTSPQHGYTERTSTDADGSFGLLVVAGMEGQLDGVKGIIAPILASCPELKVGPKIRGLFRFIDASPIALSSDSDQENLKLVLPSPSCKAWRN